MKTFRTLCAACVLALALALPVSAGHISMGETPPPPPPPPTGMASADGHIETDCTITDSVTEAALTLIQIALSLS